MKSILSIFLTTLLIVIPAVPVYASSSEHSGEANSPYVIGMLDAGYRIYYGQAVPPYLAKDYATAIPYASQAADLGVPEAENMMGFISYHGLGTKRDLDMAFEYYLRASQHGAFESPKYLSQCYAQGIGTDLDPVKAAYWMGVYDSIQANPPERNKVLSPDAEAVLPADRPVLIPGEAEFSVLNWVFQDQFAYLANENASDDYRIIKSGTNHKLFAVFLSYTNLSALPRPHDEYITHVSIDAGQDLVFDSNISILQLTQSKSGYVITDEVFLPIQPGEITTLAFVFTLPAALEKSPEPFAFHLRFNGNPVTFNLPYVTSPTATGMPPILGTPGNKFQIGGNALTDVVKGEKSFTFGRYEQDNNLSNGPESISWRVLTVERNRALLISEYCLDTKPYNTEWKEITWETSTLRAWLNREFLNAAFTADERKIISVTALKNDDNPKDGTDGGRDTQDRVFLLSVAEVEQYFENDADRIARFTTYARVQGGIASDSVAGWWWLRSPGGQQGNAAFVSLSGSVAHHGSYIILHDYSIRPAFWLDLSSP